MSGCFPLPKWLTQFPLSYYPSPLFVVFTPTDSTFLINRDVALGLINLRDDIWSAVDDIAVVVDDDDRISASGCNCGRLVLNLQRINLGQGSMNINDLKHTKIWL